MATYRNLRNPVTLCCCSVLERGFEPPEGGVYISYYLFGSPAHKHKLVPKTGATTGTTTTMADETPRTQAYG